MDFDKIGSHALATNGIDNIKFDKCRINKINAFAFTSRQPIYEISFERSRIDSIENQAFKKMYINQLRFHNTIITNPIVGRAFYDLVITESMLITNCTLSSITSSAFVFQGFVIHFLRFFLESLSVSKFPFIETENLISFSRSE